MPKFVPDNFQPKDKDIEWAMHEFNIARTEVDRQVELLRDHEFRRNYTDWNRVFRNWMRKADEIQTLKREQRLRRPEELTDEQRAADIRKWEDDMRRLRVVK